MPRTIIHSIDLFDGISVQPNSSVIFSSDSGLIESVKHGSINLSVLSSNEVVIDGTDCTLMPGLIDGHIHVHDLHLPKENDSRDMLKTPLRCGITTVCDMHSDTETVLMFRSQIRDELIKAKEVASTGTVTQSDLKSSFLAAMIHGGWPEPIVLGHDPSPHLQQKIAAWARVTEDNAEEFVKSNKADGADYIKLMQEDCCSMAWPTGSIPSASPSLQLAVTRAAHSNKLKAVAHALSVDNTALVLEAGVDGLTHTFFDQPPNEEIIKLYRDTGAFLIPTLTVISSLTNDEHDLRSRIAEAAYTKGLLDDSARALMLQTASSKAPGSRLEYAYDSVRKLKVAGIEIVAGTDSVAGLKGMALGPSLWMELEQYVERCGLTPLEALRSATETCARRFGFTDRGTVEVGKRADLIMVKGKPFENLHHLWEGAGILHVWKQGFMAE